MRKRLFVSLLGLSLFWAAGCNISQPRIGPSPTKESEAIVTVAPQLPATATPASPTATSTKSAPAAAAATATPTQAPTATVSAASPTATLPYFEYLVGEGETLFYIIQLPQHGYGYEPNVAATVVALNANIPDADSVRGGITIRIPRPTLTPTPPGAEATQELLATIGADDSSAWYCFGRDCRLPYRGGGRRHHWRGGPEQYHFGNPSWTESGLELVRL